MKTSRNNFPERIAILALVTLLAVVVAGCSRRDAAQAQALPAERPSRPALDPLAVVLASHHGGHRVDVQIREHQGMVRSNLQREAALERLGWLYVAKARDSFDAGFYALANGDPTQGKEFLKSAGPGAAAVQAAFQPEPEK